ncbi:MAG: beta-phosphoglucomutase [Clostridia bacterium]|nr:beta-phosphoglucomutase [Clostridia bacterium]
MIKGIIFDLDGVLLSTDEYHYMAWKSIADKLGIYFDKQINNKLRGVSRMDSLEIILGKNNSFSVTEKEMLAEEKNELYRTYLAELKPSAVEKSVRETLDKIRALDIKTAIGSSSKNTRYILEKTDLTHYFNAISDGNNITKSKPDPEVFLKAAEYIGLPPSECIVVEDAHAGIDAAKAGGFTAVAIGDARTHSQADYKINELKELLKIIA